MCSPSKQLLGSLKEGSTPFPRKMKYNLPKPYLSYSQVSMWQKNKDQYRQRYYLNAPAFENIEIIFGKKVAKMLEEGVDHPVLNKVPKYKFTEYRVEKSVGDVPFLAVFDSFSKLRSGIIEYKTGKEPWDDVRVAKHRQLDTYSLMAKIDRGWVDPWCRLVWMETRYAPVMDSIGSFKCERDGNELEFTGKIKTFWRRISEWERKKMKETIQQVAREISEDYTNFQKTL
jgi:hypothetical protein